jgi:biotin carboxylase
MFFIKKQNKRNKKYFISIGAGFNQLPLINEAKNLGFLLICVDQNTSAIGFSEADIKIQESITDYEEIYKKIQELLLDGEIIGILSRSYGAAVKTTSFLAEKLNIPYIPFDKIDNLLNKKRMKKTLVQQKINTPKYKILNEKKISSYNYPLIIKPAVGHAKNGVKLINSEKILKSYIKQCTDKAADYLIEEYVTGDEIIAIGLIVDKKFHLIEITDKELTRPPYFVDIKHISPSKHKNRWSEITQIGQKIATAFEVKSSPLLIELRIDKNDQLFVLETAAEFGGEFLSDILIPNKTGYNLINQALRAICGEKFSPPLSKKNQQTVIVQYITGSVGRLKSFNPIDTKHNENIIFSKIFKDLDSKIQKPASNHDRIGVVIAKGKNAQLASQTIEKAIEDLNLIIK